MSRDPTISAPWRDGFVAPWRAGFVAPWRAGFVAPWRAGFVAPWQPGFVAPWRDELLACREAGLASLGLAIPRCATVGLGSGRH
jgi:hypothetical protein